MIARTRPIPSPGPTAGSQVVAAREVGGGGGHAADGEVALLADVEALVMDVRPPSVNAVANAIERRDGPRAAEAQPMME